VTPRPVAERLRRHSLTRLTVLEEQRLLFLPVPKSGCTSMLWLLAGLAGLPAERFRASGSHEVSRAMTVHDMTSWGAAYRWLDRTEEEQAALLADPCWLRFSIVRDPAPRLWSAWQSKVLLHEPRFVERFGDQAWWPGPTPSVGAVVDSFRAFVHALDTDPDTAPHDAHWGAQSQLVDGFALKFVGRAEDPDTTRALLEQHLGPGSLPRGPLPRENANPIPFHPSVYDDATAEVANRVFAADLDAFGYRAIEPTADPDAGEWRERAEAALPLVDQLVERHLRIGDLLGALSESEARRRPLSQQVAALEQSLRDIHASRSWRVTRPLRAVRRRDARRP
jgi:hypothetical protein